jgi:hypothetical protein
MVESLLSQILIVLRCVVSRGFARLYSPLHKPKIYFWLPNLSHVVLKARFHLATRLCICPVCDVSLCSHSVPSGGFNSSADTNAKNKSPFWMGPISGVLSNSNGTIMVLCSDFLSNSFVFYCL